MNLVNAGLNRVAVASREALRGEGGGEERSSWLVAPAVAPSFLQPLERGGPLLAGSIAARPKPQLAPRSAFEHRKLDPQLRDRRARLPFLDPRADQAEQLRRAAQWMAHDRLTLFGIRLKGALPPPAPFDPQPHPPLLPPAPPHTQL